MIHEELTFSYDKNILWYCFLSDLRRPGTTSGCMEVMFDNLRSINKD